MPPFAGWVAQLVEQRTENPCVGGSIPPPATTLFTRVFFISVTKMSLEHPFLTFSHPPKSGQKPPDREAVSPSVTMHLAGIIRTLRETV
jgi:hypothetical protein